MSIVKALKFFSPLIFLLVTSSASAQEYIAYTPDNENIQYEGRIDFSNPSKPAFAYPGISIKAKFRGTAVKINLNGAAGQHPNYFNVFIDGAFVKKFKLEDENLSEICQTGLTDSIHTVTVTKRTESFCGKVEFLGFDIVGELLSPEPLPTKKIQFIGNSITCGYGNEDVPTNGFSSDKENNYLAYGAICSRILNTQYQAIAYSGRGITYNWACSEGDVVPVLYEKIFADDPLTPQNQYHHSDYVPDLIVINLGTNDHSCDLLTDQNFKEPYVEFIAKLKSYYPSVKILCLTGPMNSSDVFRTRVQDVVASSGGEAQGIYYFDQTHIINANYAGGHWHPNTQMAQINGEEVANFIAENNLLGLTQSSEPTFHKIEEILSPNPVSNSGSLHLDLSKINPACTFSLKITNIQGKLFLSKKLQSGQMYHLKTPKSKGLYFVVLQNESTMYGGTFIVF